MVNVIEALNRLLLIPNPTINNEYPKSPITTEGIPARHCSAVNI